MLEYSVNQVLIFYVVQIGYIPATQQKFNEILASLEKGEEGVFVLFYAPGIGKMGLLKEIAWGNEQLLQK